MSLPPNVNPLLLQIGTIDHLDEDEFDQLARSLLSEINDLDVVSAEVLKSGVPPEGAKAAGEFSSGSLAVSVVPMVLPKLLELIYSWLIRHRSCTVKIKTQMGNHLVEVEYSQQIRSPDEVKRLVINLVETLSTGQ